MEGHHQGLLHLTSGQNIYWLETYKSLELTQQYRIHLLKTNNSTFFFISVTQISNSTILNNQAPKDDFDLNSAAQEHVLKFDFGNLSSCSKDCCLGTCFKIWLW